MLEDHADILLMLPQGFLTERNDICTIYHHLSRIRRFKCIDKPHQSRLPGTTFADYAEYFFLLYRQCNIVDRFKIPIFTGKRFCCRFNVNQTTTTFHYCHTIDSQYHSKYHIRLLPVPHRDKKHPTESINSAKRKYVIILIIVNINLVITITDDITVTI